MAKKFTVADGIAQPHNNFDLIRLIAAILVLFSHCYPLVTTSNGTEPVGQFGFTTLGGIAVCIFFVISGFLITQSYLKRHDLIEFLAARCLRIFPGYWVAMLIFCGLMIGPLVTNLPLASYFSDPQFWKFMRLSSLMHVQYELPGVFLNNPAAKAVNGSPWTLIYELKLYLLVAGFGFFGILKRNSLAIISTFFLIFLMIFIYKKHFFIDPTRVIFYSFALGALATFFKDKIILSPWILLGLFLITAAFVGHNNTRDFAVFFYLTIAYGTLWFAYQPYFQEYRITRYGDFSYGIYIYAFPVQQTLVHFFHFQQPWKLFLTAFPITLSLAILSWFYIERPALRQKRKVHAFLTNLPAATLLPKLRKWFGTNIKR